ncbi:integrase, catalytic region, zinc finger, CCHC-type containing protein [Tanacetum coccineum]
MKDLVANKQLTEDDDDVRMNPRSSALFQNLLPPKENDPGSFILPCSIGRLDFNNALADLRANISIMPFSMFKRLGIGKLKPINMVIEMADDTKCIPKKIVKNLLIKIDKFILPIGFVILDITEDFRMPVILGRPLLATAHAKVDIFRKTISLEVGNEKVQESYEKILYKCSLIAQETNGEHRFGEVSKTARDKILRDHWRKRFRNEYEDSEEFKDPEGCRESKENKILGTVLKKLHDEWFKGTDEDDDDLEGIIDYLETILYDGFVDSDDEEYKERKCRLLGMPYIKSPPILIEKVNVTRYSIGPGEVYTKIKVSGVEELSRTRGNIATTRAGIMDEIFRNDDNEESYDETFKQLGGNFRDRLDLYLCDSFAELAAITELGSELGSELTLLAGSELKTSELDTSELKTSEYRGKENGVNILKSIDEGPFQMGTFRETLTDWHEGALHLGPERPRVYSHLSPKDKERPHKGVKASANSDVMYSFTSAQDGNPLQDDVRLCLGDDLKKAQDHSQRQAIYHIYKPSAQCISVTTQNNVDDNSLTAELATYKEQVELYERRAKFKLTEREQKIDEQLRIVITDHNCKEESLKRELHSKENKYLEEFLDMKALKEKVEDKLYKQDQSLQIVHMLCQPKPYYDEQNKVAIAYKNPLCLTRAQQVQPALYNGHEIIKTNHVPAIVHNSEDTLEIAEITRKKMNDKMKDPECVKMKVNIAPHDYSKENYLATFIPQKQLTPEQIFWSNDLIKMKAECLKEQTTASRPIKALMVYPPNTPATLVPKVLPTKSQVKINIFALIQLFSKFEKTYKKRITPTGLTEGEGGFEQTKECYLTKVIPFFKTLKEHFEGIQKDLTKEIKEMKDIFEELEAEVDQNVVNRKHDEIERKKSSYCK